MSQYELIAFDMDGTLLNSQKEITPRTLAALKKAAAAGKQIALSRGAAVRSLRPIQLLFPESGISSAPAEPLSMTCMNRRRFIKSRWSRSL